MSSSRGKKEKYQVFHLVFHYQTNKETHALTLLKNLQSPDEKKKKNTFIFSINFSRSAKRRKRRRFRGENMAARL